MNKLLKVVLQRLALGLLTLFIVSIIIAAGMELIPGSLAERVLGQSATPETVAALEQRLGLDQPAHIRYVKWLGGILQGDFGASATNQRPISELIGERLWNTLFLAAFAAILAVPIALVLGVLAALYRNGFYDRAVNVATLSSISTPEFFVAYILIWFLSVVPIQNGWTLGDMTLGFPSVATDVKASMSLGDRIYSVFLPALTLTLVVIAHMMRMTRASIINLLASPYIEMANLKGLPRSRIILKHALPNAWAPIINVIVLNLAYLIVGVVIVEVVFSYPGLGKLMVDMVSAKDLPVVQACSMIFAATYVLLNLTADILSIVTNPRLLHPK